MSNIRIRQAVERLAREAGKVEQHAVNHAGVSAADWMAVDNACSEAIQAIAHIAELARIAGGNTSGKSLRRAIRKALGFTLA